MNFLLHWNYIRVECKFFDRPLLVSKLYYMHKRVRDHWRCIMRKAILFLSSWLAIIGALRLIAPHWLSQLIAIDVIAAWLAIAVAGLALANGLRWFSLLDLRTFFRALGVVLLVTTCYGINSPTFGDIRQTYVPLTDLFIALESGIVMLLLSAEKSDEALSPLVYLSLIATYLYRRLIPRWSPHWSPSPTLSRRKLV